MSLVLKRLALGVALIVLVSGALLASDWGRRRSSADRVQHLAILQHASQEGAAQEGLIAGHAPLARKWKVDLLEYVNVLDVEDAEAGMRPPRRRSRRGAGL